MRSMSSCLPRTRTHFCTEVARGYGGSSSPRKMGRNWFMPALVNSGAAGWWGMSPEDGTTVCPRSAKKPVKARRSSLASISRLSLPGASGQPSLQLGPQFGLALARRLPSLGQRRPHVGSEAAQPVGDVVRHPLGRVALDGLAQEAAEPEGETEA